ncbi:MAG: hypothetical protein LC104_01595 [Bacteroidales bacterium]|nr:hypothetical protein [Bacteroidales bacterium]
MNTKLSLSQLIDTFTGMAIVVLLAVMAERDEPGGHQHYTLLVILVLLMLVHAASGYIAEFFNRRKPSDAMDDHRKEGDDQ